jgi:hypothetical protein
LAPPKGDDFVKSRNPIEFVIPAKAGIQLFQDVLDPGFRRGDDPRDFLRDQQMWCPTYYYSDNSQNPPYSPFAKGGNCYPPLWKRGARGDFLIKPLNLSVLHRAINAICRSSIIMPDLIEPYTTYVQTL